MDEKDKKVIEEILIEFHQIRNELGFFRHKLQNGEIKTVAEVKSLQENLKKLEDKVRINFHPNFFPFKVEAKDEQNEKKSQINQNLTEDKDDDLVL